MIWLACQTLRSRWQVFIGTFLALTFGVCLMATTLLCIAGTRSGTAEDDWLRSVAITLLGNAAGVSGAAAIFVVSGTFALAVTQRRREFALLRAIGATPRQVRRLVMGESFLIGLAAAIAGCGLGMLVAPHFARWMARVELAPVDFAPTITWWPLIIASVVGLFSALVSAWLASRRASRVRPVEALTIVSIDTRMMTPIRWIVAALFLLGAALLIPVVLNADAGVGSAYILLEILLLLFGCMMLVPLFAPVLIRLASLPFRGTMSQLAKANSLTSLRQTSSLIAPIFITIGLAAASYASVATLAETQRRAVQHRVTAPLVVTKTDGMDSKTVAAIRQASQDATFEPATNSAVLLAKGSDRNSDRLQTIYIQPTIGRVMHMPLISGKLASLTGSTMIVSEKMAEAHHWRLGSTQTLWLDNGSAVPLKVIAIMPDSDDLGSTMLLPEALRKQIEPNLPIQTIYMAPSAGTPASRLKNMLGPVALSNGAQVVDTRVFLDEHHARDVRIDQVALLTVVGLAVLYTAISIANTCIMATTGRFRDFAVLQLSGALRKQVVQMVILETCFVVFVAAVMAFLVTAAALAITYASAASPQLVVPWTHIGTVAVACLVIALATSGISLLWSFRTPPIRIAAARE